MKDLRHLRKFVAPEYVFGNGARFLASRYAANLGGRKILVVSDAGVAAAGWTAEITENLAQAHLPFAVFSDVSPNPRAGEVMAGADLFFRENCNVIVAIGGGSALDCAKGIGIVSTDGRNILEFQGVDVVERPMCPLICIPTTGGSSADVSQFAIITDLHERNKLAIISKAVVPDVSLVDPDTLSTVDPYLMACTALDALTHGIEAFVSRASSPVTDMHALEAIRLISGNLSETVQGSGDREKRVRIMLGSLHAGLAFSNAILGANHAMAHSLGGHLDLAHGECNAILLDRVVEFNFSAVPEKFEQIAGALGQDLRGMNSREKQRALVRELRRLKKATGLERHLGALGVKAADVGELGRKAVKDPCLVTNPRRVERRDLEVLYEEAL